MEQPEGYYHRAPEPVEAPPFCDRCFGCHAWNAACPEDDFDGDEDDDEDDDGYPGPCTNAGGHSWVVSDENEEISYCEHCGADGNA